MKKLLVTVCSLFIATSAFSQQLPDSSGSLGQNMKIGQKVTVRLTDGKVREGSVTELNQTELVIASKSGTERIMAPRIQEVSRRHRDSLWNGLIIGAAAGALMGWAAIAANDCDYDECGEAGVVPGGIVIGAALGTGLDLLLRERQVLYRAPQSQTSLRIQILMGQVTGTRVSWRF